MTDEPEGKYQLSVAENDPEIIRLLGIITARWATMDEILVRLFGRLLNNNPAADVIYYSLESFGARLDVITNLTTEFMKDDHPSKKKLVTLLNRLNRLSGVRNKIVHTNIFQIPETRQLMHDVRRPGRKNSSQMHPVKANDLLQHANALVNVAGDLSFIIDPKLEEELVRQIVQRHELRHRLVQLIALRGKRPLP
jgi:hypothetical protein